MSARIDSGGRATPPGQLAVNSSTISPRGRRHGPALAVIAQAWLLTARAVQGAGAAITAPAALSLVTTTFPEGPPRNRAMGVFAAMSVTGGVVGLIAGGLLTTYDLAVGAIRQRADRDRGCPGRAPGLAETPGHRGRFDLPGAITGTGGLAALVYGLSNAATSPDGVSHWGDAKVVASLAAAAVLLGLFVLTEMRTKNPLLPPRLLASRDRWGANLIMLCVGTALFGVFFFLTLFMQAVWGYSAVKIGVAYLPMMAAIMAMSGASVQLVPRIGARPLLLAGSVTAAGGMFWMSRISEHSHYVGGLLGPTVVAGAGLGMLFMPLTVTALSRVQASVAGAASSLINAGQQVGGSIGLAVLGTVAWTTVANGIRGQAAAAARTAARTGHPVQPSASGRPSAAIYQHALATGFSRGFEVAAAILLLGLLVAIAAIRVRRADLDGMQGPP